MLVISNESLEVEGVYSLSAAMTPSSPTAAYTPAPPNAPAMGVHKGSTVGWLYHRRSIWLQKFKQIGNALKRGCLGTDRQAEQQHDRDGSDYCSHLPHGDVLPLRLLCRFTNYREIQKFSPM